MNKELSDILIRKDFKTFWHCLDFLLLAGYPLMEAFSHSIKQFGPTNIFKLVAFIRIEEPAYHMLILPNHAKKREIKIGIINDDNIHLDGMYATYRKILIHKPYLRFDVDIEATCEVITIECLSLLILEYLSDVSLVHFGYDALKKVENNEDREKLMPQVKSPVDEYFGNIDTTSLLNEMAIKLKIK